MADYRMDRYNKICDEMDQYLKGNTAQKTVSNVLNIILGKTDPKV